jgi:hypothetical protein
VIALFASASLWRTSQLGRVLHLDDRVGREARGSYPLMRPNRTRPDRTDQFIRRADSTKEFGAGGIAGGSPLERRQRRIDECAPRLALFLLCPPGGVRVLRLDHWGTILAFAFEPLRLSLDFPRFERSTLLDLIGCPVDPVKRAGQACLRSPRCEPRPV